MKWKGGEAESGFGPSSLVRTVSCLGQGGVSGGPAPRHKHMK